MLYEANVSITACNTMGISQKQSNLVEYMTEYPDADPAKVGTAQNPQLKS